MKKCDKKLHFINIQKLTNFPYIEADFDALTDYELISKIGGGLNELIKSEENQNEIIEELLKDFKDLKDYVDKYLVDVEDIKEEIETINETLVVLARDIKTNSNNIINLRVELLNIINDNYNRIIEYVDYQYGYLNERIDNLDIGDLSVYNPTTGTRQPLQIVINSLYEASNKDGLTATEFDTLELTATAFDAYNITAYDFDSSGKTILV